VDAGEKPFRLGEIVAHSEGPRVSYEGALSL
jgi:hypothetical protein